MADSTPTTQQLSGNGPGQAIPIGNSPLTSVQLSGTFTADVDIEVSNNGTVWVLQETLSAPGLVNVTLDAAQARVNVRNYIAGPIDVNWHQVS